jgi:LytS/YehU family sensor histidine kinase
MTIAFTVVWHLYDYVAQRKKLDQAEQKQMQTELSFLKAQINPHFLFNNLNNLYALAIKKSEKTPDAILQLSSLLRYLLYDSNTPQVSFEKEKEIIAAYIELERLRLADDSGLHLIINADRDYSIPPLLWLPVLENMFKYGVHALHGGHYGQFIFNIKDGSLRLYSRNRFDPQQDKSGASGIGFRNLQKRLELLYEGRHSFVRGVEDDHYIVDISIELS